MLFVVCKPLPVKILFCLCDRWKKKKKHPTTGEAKKGGVQKNNTAQRPRKFWKNCIDDDINSIHGQHLVFFKQEINVDFPMCWGVIMLTWAFACSSRYLIL